MLNPEITDTLIWMAEGKVVVRLGMSKESGIEVQLYVLTLGPIHPGCKMPEFDFITVRPFIRVHVHRVKVHAM